MPHQIPQEEIDKLFLNEAERILKEEKPETNEEWVKLFHSAAERISKEKKVRNLTQQEIDNLYERAKKIIEEKGIEGLKELEGSTNITTEEAEEIIETVFVDIDKNNKNKNKNKEVNVMSNENKSLVRVEMGRAKKDNNEIIVEIGRTEKTAQEIAELGERSIIDLNKNNSEPLDVFIKNQLVAKGRVIVIHEVFNIEITEIVDEKNNTYNFKINDVIELDGKSTDSVNVFANDKLIAKGQTIVIENNFGVRINAVLPNPDKMSMEEIDRLLFHQSKDIRIDGLTKCKSSPMFGSDFDEMLEKAGEKYSDLTLALIDIDNFMRANDTFGHKVGDEVLIEVGRILMEIDADKSVYRYSGDEFAVLFPDMEKEQAFLLMDKARETISKAAKCVETSITTSIGISTYAEDGTRQTDLVRKADGALYRAKSTGRNKVCLAKEEKLVTKTVHFTVEQLKRLKELSDSISIGEAALMREALDDLLKKYNEKKKVEPTVLIIDDAAFMRMMLKDILTKNGDFKVVGEAADGKEGIEKFKELNPDFVLLDITMPNMDGLTFLKNIERTPKNHIVMVSAMGQASYVIESFKQGAEAFIVKPFQADRITNTLKNIEKYGIPENCFAKFADIIMEYKVDKLSQAQIDEAMELCKK